MDNKLTRVEVFNDKVMTNLKFVQTNNQLFTF